MLRKLSKPLLALFAFLLMQLLAGVCIVPVQYFLHKVPAEVLAVAVGGSGILSVLVCQRVLKMINLSSAFDVKAVRWNGAVWWGILGCIAAIIGTDLAIEQCNLPDVMEEQQKGLVASPLGIVVVALLGPVVEELVFREAIIGQMLRDRFTPGAAILFSALCFGVMHMNPVQIPFAMVVGVVLGILYYKTGNIVLTSIVHILNNSLSVLEMNLLGDEASTFSYTEAMGGKTIAMAVIFTAIAISVFSLSRFWKKS